MYIKNFTPLFAWILSLGFAFSNFVFAQAYYGDIDKKLQAGVVAYGYGYGITGSFDKGINDYISLGVGADLYVDEDTNDDTNFYLFGRFNGHLGEFMNLPLNMDIYPGASLGITGDRLGVGVYGGFRYFFNEKVGIYAEIGNHGRLGVSISL